MIGRRYSPDGRVHVSTSQIPMPKANLKVKVRKNLLILIRCKKVTPGKEERRQRDGKKKTRRPAQLYGRFPSAAH